MIAEKYLKNMDRLLYLAMKKLLTHCGMHLQSEMSFIYGTSKRLKIGTLNFTKDINAIDRKLIGAMTETTMKFIKNLRQNRGAAPEHPGKKFLSHQA